MFLKKRKGFIKYQIILILDHKDIFIIFFESSFELINDKDFMQTFFKKY